MRFQCAFFGLSSSKRKLLNVKARVLDSGHFPINFFFLLAIRVASKF